MNRIKDMKNTMDKFYGNTASVTPTWYNSDNNKNTGGKFLHYVLGRYMLDTCHIGRLNGVVHIYNKDKRFIC